MEWDPPLDEYDGEYVQIENRGPGNQDMTGWSLRDQGNHTYFFPEGFILAGGGVNVRVWTKEGKDTQAHLFWGRSSPVWGNDGDAALLYDANGILIDFVSWP